MAPTFHRFAYLPLQLQRPIWLLAIDDRKKGVLKWINKDYDQFYRRIACSSKGRWALVTCNLLRACGISRRLFPSELRQANPYAYVPETVKWKRLLGAIRLMWRSAYYRRSNKTRDRRSGRLKQTRRYGYLALSDSNWTKVFPFL